jgi:carbamoyl-phosphate synthase large subunit
MTRVLLTAVGSPGNARLIAALKQNGEREVQVIGTDMSARSGGRFLCDAFGVVPPGASDEFAPAVAEIARREGADVVFPTSSSEVASFARARELFEVPLMCASGEAVAACDDKAATYDLALRVGVRVPQTLVAAGPEEVRAAAAALGYPERDICIKPPTAKGSRGFHVISAGVDKRQQVLHARPGPMPLSIDELLAALGTDDFPTLLVMELLQGTERTVDGICRGGRFVLGHAKTREAMRAGLAMFFQTVDDPALVDATRRLVAGVELDWFVNAQFMGDALLEINPRISTIVYQEDFNLPWLAVRHALGELSEADLAEMGARVRPTRRALRYYDQVEYDDGDG